MQSVASLNPNERCLISIDMFRVLNYNETYYCRRYPGNWKPNQWSIMHHMEIIDRKLQEMGVTSFIQ